MRTGPPPFRTLTFPSHPRRMRLPQYTITPKGVI
jgi:hypothetical protein